MLGRGTRWAATLLLVPGLVGCSIGDVRRPPPAATTAAVQGPTAPPAPPPVPFDEVREVQFAVAERYDRPAVEFVDARRGYALFAWCDARPAGPACPALLYATVDGGRSWRKLRHPDPTAPDQQLYAAAGAVAVWSEPQSWYVSTDGGVSFTASRHGVPAAWTAAQGRFRVVESTGKIAEWAGRRLRPLAAQPGLPGLPTVASRDDHVVVAGVQDGKAVAATSFDGGRSWRREPVPAHDGEVGVVRAVVDPVGGAWLIGERSDKVTFPAIWRQRSGWEPVRAVGHPQRFRSIVAIGGGVLVVTGPEGPGVVAGDRYHRMGWPLTPQHHLTVLADGTLCARGPDDIVLAAGPPAERRWLRIVLDRR